MTGKYEELDEGIKKIIAKADRIVNLEQIQQERIETLTALREEDGRVKININQKKEKLSKLKSNFETARRLWEEYSLYFELLQTYSGEKLLEELSHQIEDYTWSKYSKIQDKLYEVTEDKGEAELEAEIVQVENEIRKLEERRSDLVDNALIILQEIDARIEETKNQ